MAQYSPQYLEIYRRKEVLGISMLFMAIDIGGGIFSTLSLVFRERFDTVASVSYIAVVVSLQSSSTLAYTSSH